MQSYPGKSAKSMTESVCELAADFRNHLTISHIKSERCTKKCTSPTLSRSISENSQFADLAEHVGSILDAHLGVDVLAVGVHRVAGEVVGNRFLV